MILYLSIEDLAPKWQGANWGQYIKENGCARRLVLTEAKDNSEKAYFYV